MTYARYPSYGAEVMSWIGPIPTTWQIVPNRVVLRHKQELVGAFSENYQLLSLTNRGVIVRDTSENKGKYPAAFDTYQKVNAKDLIFCLFDIEETPRTVGLAAQDGMITGAYDVFEVDTRIATPRYVEYLYIALDAKKSLSYFYTGLRKVIRTPTFKSIRMPLPPLADQVTIADFLDRETDQIDRLIGKQNALIELLGERRRAVITRAMTRGLDSSAPTRDSGVAWLGHIPADWDCRRFSHVVSVNGGQVDPRVLPYSEMLLIAPNHVERGTGRLLARESAADQGADSGKYLIKNGQVIYSKIRPALAKAVIAPEDCLSSADMYGLRPRRDLPCDSFLLQIVLSKPFTDFAVDASMRVAMPKINREALAAGAVWFPPLSQQSAIVHFIEMRTKDIDAAISVAERFVRLLQERRSALITAAVTGEIDVRGAA